MQYIAIAAYIAIAISCGASLVARDIASALLSLYSHPVFHRDLKPNNVLPRVGEQGDLVHAVKLSGLETILLHLTKKVVL